LLSNGGDFQGDTISQTFATTLGTVYNVDFDGAIFGKRSGNPLQIQVQVVGSGTLLNQTVTPPEAGTFTPAQVTFNHFHFTFTADGSSATIRFISVGSGNSTADQVVDTVVVRPQ
jgi:hypothetical protein